MVGIRVRRPFRAWRGTSAALLIGLAGVLAALPAAAQTASQETQAEDGFRGFIAGLWPEARARGVSRVTFDSAFSGVTINPGVVALTKKQSEFVQPIWVYVAGALSQARLDRGRAAADDWSAALAALERDTGVDREVILGIWGMETNFGSFKGDLDVIRSLATLAFVRYRGTFFRDELIHALVILEQGHAKRGQLKGSWAGAMGHTQFMPSSFLTYASDGDGDGRADIWTSPRDGLASTANYLKEKGWKAGLPWGFEVVLPSGFDFRQKTATFSQWTERGVVRANGRSAPRTGTATLFLPAGAKGPAFLITENYAVIKTYNNSDAYALSVGLLGRRLGGGGVLAGTWPTRDPQLTKAQQMEVQRRLKALGLYTADIDGRLGSQTRDSVRTFQLAQGLQADGYPTPALLETLRKAR